MIDKYLILNRKPTILMHLFIYNITSLTGLIIWCINTFSYQNYFLIHSQILNLNSYYYIEVLIPAKEVNKITRQNKLWIEDKLYQYKVVNIDNNIVFKNEKNYIKLYLEVDCLEKKYQMNGYHMDIKVKKSKEEK